MHTLQGRNKWYVHQPNFSVGDVVLVNSPNKTPMAWHLGKIEAVHPGADDIVRVATVKTAEGTFKRPVVKLVKLPIA